MQRRALSPVWPIGAILVILLQPVLVRGLLQARQPQSSKPVVDAAAVPFYPLSWRMAGMKGGAKLEVSTDGAKIAGVRFVSGSRAVQELAEQNLRTWVFREHAPTTFEVEYTYKLEGVPECGVSDSGTVVLRLPYQVDVRARGVGICEDLSKKIQ